MALKYGIFPGVKIGTTDDGLPISDRAVDDAYFARYHSMFLSNGVYGKSSSCGQVLAGSGMELIVQPIDVFINGWYAYDLDPESLTLSAASESRTDIVVAQLNIPDRLIKIYVKSGTTDLTRTNDIWELCLAQVAVSKGQTVIAQSAIRDTRLNSNLCGLVTGVINQVNPDTLLAQMESWFADQKSADEADFKHWYDAFTTQSKSDFDTWFAGIKNTLSGDAAGNLLNMINAIINSKGQPNGIGGLNSNGALPPEQGGTGQNSLSAFRNAAGLGNTTGPLPIKNGGTEASTVIDAIKNLGLSPEVISTGGHYILLKVGSVMNLRIYGASANSIPTIPMQYRPHTIDATGFAWILGSSPQAGILIVSGYNGNVSSCVMSGPDVSDTECRGSVMWIAN